MSSVEDLTRAAMDAITADVDGAPPLPLPPPAAERRWGPWLAPAAAAAAVIAIAAAALLVRTAPARGPAGQPAGQPVPAITAPAGYPAAVPPYYVAIPGDMAHAPAGAPAAVIGDTFTGERLATLPAPAGWKFVSVAAAADDRTFVVGAVYKPQFPAYPVATRWYLISVTPGAPATLRQLPITEPRNVLQSIALSPDGTKFALMAFTGVEVLRVYSVATGALLHTWSGSTQASGSIVGPTGPLLSWTTDGQLAFQWQDIPPNGSPVRQTRLIRVSDPGHDLIADSRSVWSTPVSGSSESPARHPLGCGGVYTPSVLVAGDGKTVVCGAWGVFRDPGKLPDGTCPAVPSWNDEGVFEYSTATGKATTLYRTESACVPPFAGQNPVQLLWASESGDAVIGYFDFQELNPIDRPVIRFGLFTAGTFTPLPAPPTIATDPAFTAW